MPKSLFYGKGEEKLNHKTGQTNSLFHSFLLLLTATVWGVAFVAQSVGMDYVGPLSFVAGRCVVAVVTLTPVLVLSRSRRSEADKRAVANKPHDVVLGGFLCGFFLFLGFVTQQYGMMTTTVSKAGFITAFYVVLVPLLGLFLGRRIGWRIWVAVALAVAGLYFLCMAPGEFYFAPGDMMVLLSALCFTFQITVIGHYVNKVDGVLLSFMQLVTCGILGVPAALLFEDPSWDTMLAAAVPIIYAGAFSSALGFTLQIIGQRGVSPTAASLIMSLESAIAAIAGWLLLGEVMTIRQILGCILMMIAIVLSQLPADLVPAKTRKRAAEK